MPPTDHSRIPTLLLHIRRDFQVTEMSSREGSEKIDSDMYLCVCGQDLLSRFVWPRLGAARAAPLRSRLRIQRVAMSTAPRPAQCRTALCLHLGLTSRTLIMAEEQRSKIQKLDEAVVNRIAAGEIIHRPANALKEMIENSLDAKATAITVVAKDGGLKLLQITDNGSGIDKDDMDLVCERFATSKLRKYEDLNSICTYGFRGEALASISHVAHVSITTKTASSPCAWKAHYADGKMTPPKPGTKAEPKACAGNNGTQITVEDLFFNVATRRKALKNTSEEYSKILDIVQKYAIHNAGVSFTCKKHGHTTSDLFTSSTATTIDNIRAWDFSMKGNISNANYNTKKMIFLLFINHRAVDSINLKRAIENVYQAYLPKGTHPFVYMSLEIKPQNVDVNVHPTKREVHFLNEDSIIETICEALQESLKDANSSRIFYTQVGIAAAACTGVSTCPAHSVRSPAMTASSKPYQHDLVRTDSKTRTLDAFITRADTPGAVAQSLNSSRTRTTSIELLGSQVNLSDKPDDRTAAVDVDTVADPMSVDDHEPVARVPAKRKIEEALGNSASGAVGGEQPEADAPLRSATDEGEQVSIRSGPHEHDRAATKVRFESDITPSTESVRDWVDVRLISILELRSEVQEKSHAALTELFRRHVWVGIAKEPLAVVQHQTGLYLVNYHELSCHLFYQLALKAFMNFGIMTLSAPVSISSLLSMALEDPELISEIPVESSAEEIAESVVATILSKRELLSEYFAIGISEEGYLTTLPILLKGYVPNMAKLPLFLLRLGTEVGWEAEKECFEALCWEIGLFYSVEEPVIIPGLLESTEGSQGRVASAGTPDDTGSTPRSEHASQQSTPGVSPKHPELEDYYWTIEHVVFPAFRCHLVVPKEIATSGSVVEIANLKDLYKVFERC
ncbi:DNA mismatch repair protein Mlh1 [Polychytrium aggregatum]|uniref:DNA mismatch repair protein Mlh1 n=1 Tax=Polychytrium aggregatum TaxID=110093 RepID=UPI0022FDE3DD|nr:DNA mismatch repair protein Mlh1 [Polychytrium aggregatum]KAI9208278.1 DNA mismatch repair protein Mlh1 [Polychytrium aggregatum]